MKFSKLVMSLLSSGSLGWLRLPHFGSRNAGGDLSSRGDRGDRYCTCLINRLQEKMSYEQFQQITPDNESPEVKAATNECIGAIF